MMDILQLKYFCHAAETENFSHTAQYFCVPASNISQMIKRLEQELRSELFYRTSNTIRLNENGKVFYEYAQKALRLLDEGKTAVNENEDITGEIKLLILTNRRTVTCIIEKFKAKYPKVNFIIKHTQNSGDDFDLLVSDVADSNLEKTLLVKEKIAIAMNKENPLCKKEKFDISDYKNERFIVMQQSSSLSRYTRMLCHMGGFEPNVAIETDDPFYVRKYVEMGLGVALVPMISWEGLFSDNIECKIVEGMTRSTYLWWHSDRNIKRCVKLFLDMV
ncbi:MAG: LysR family transcriptional regulator [Clostridia bacterium]|jgi:DNA-binding transcriptional LysR family regulator|nr:LysR family transcriptional regulator [Clostridia bacterium]